MQNKTRQDTGKGQENITCVLPAIRIGEKGAIMPENNQWEYLAVTIGTFWRPGKDEEVSQLLNEIGEQGWEVVSVYPMENSQKSRVIAKRILTPKVRRQRSLPGY
jgi:hypothetical protein